uniref:Uncharacterized protein n=1 Tax=Streptomyces sp. NBC_01393 TaxID=2903851 RepID=A0AAU3I0L5_9ACTN
MRLTLLTQHTKALRDAGPLRTVIRRAARGGAKSLYRVGRERVAPALRRWGQN